VTKSSAEPTGPKSQPKAQTSEDPAPGLRPQPPGPRPLTAGGAKPGPKPGLRAAIPLPQQPPKPAGGPRPVPSGGAQAQPQPQRPKPKPAPKPPAAGAAQGKPAPAPVPAGGPKNLPANVPPAQPPATRSDAPEAPVPPTAGTARPRRRHWGMVLGFLIFVVLPGALAAIYMYAIAADQYESRMGFAVRSEESESSFDILSGLTGTSSGSARDTDILYEFIQSQDMVQRINAQIDLRTVFTRPDFDPIFKLTPNASLEELVSYWTRMVRVYYDSGTGLIEVRVNAFTPDEAHQIAGLIFDESSDLINALSAVARDDATRYASEERDKAIERLISARQAMTEFRIQTQIVDPTADVASQMGLLTTLQTQLAEAMIEQDVLLQTARPNDPRLTNLDLRIEVIEKRIADERRKLGVGGNSGVDSGDPEEGYAQVFADFERLQVDLQFAETSYLTALGAYDAAVAEAQRILRYLTPYVQPTRPETSTAPSRGLITLLVVGFALLIWSIGLLVYYSLRDRR
jgi:capsular polysaccharide transport system permease protein